MYCLIVFKLSGFIAKSAIRQLFLIDVLLNKQKLWAVVWTLTIGF